MLEGAPEIGLVLRWQKSLGGGGQSDPGRHAAFQDSPFDQTAQQVSDEPVRLETEAVVEAIDAAGEMTHVLGERPLAQHCAGTIRELTTVVKDVVGRVKVERAAHVQSVASGLLRL